MGSHMNGAVLGAGIAGPAQVIPPPRIAPLADSRTMRGSASAAAGDGELFTAVTRQAGKLLATDVTILRRREPSVRLTTVGAWSRTRRAAYMAQAAPRSKAVAPVSIDGRLWGVMIAATRRRIERDLHDGAQQRLVALALQLQAERAALPPGLTELKAELGRVVAGLTDTLEELRECARGIHRAILAEGGLAAALKMLARRSPVPVELDMRTGTRLSERTEVTSYCLVSEALANAAKHAKASAVRVAVELADGVLRVSVCDDGVGGADPARGSGLVGLKDRVAAVGGTLLVHSHPGQGTRLVAGLPAWPRKPVTRSG